MLKVISSKGGLRVLRCFESHCSGHKIKQRGSRGCLMRRLVTIFGVIGITVMLTTFATGFGWAPYTYWGGGYSSSGGYYASSGMGYLPSSYSGYYGYMPSSSSTMYVMPMNYGGCYYPSSGMYYWPSSSYRKSMRRMHYY